MKNFDVEEQLTDDGAALIIKTLNGLTFDDGSTTKTIELRNDYGPRIGERVMIGRTLVKVAQKRYDDSHNLMIMDEDTKAWYKWDR